MRKMRQPFVSNIISEILNALYPSTCPACSCRTDNISVAPFCLACWATIERYSGASCRICAEPFETDYSGICGQCIKNPPPFSKAISYGIYDRVLAQAIHALKFQKTRRLHKPLGSLMLRIDVPGMDAIVPVPMHPRGLRERGFNQSLLLAKVIAKRSGVPLILDGLLKKKDTPPQIGLTAKERTNNLAGAFSAVRSFSGMHVLLVDDVMTTGATTRACAKQLRLSGASDIVVCTLARAACT
jgi:ComF family protein